MATYAALVSLMNNIIQIKVDPLVSTMFDQKQLESLLERVDSLLVSVERENNSEELERQIASAAHSAEDIIESHIVDQILDMNSIWKKVMKVMSCLLILPCSLRLHQENFQLVMLDMQEIIQDMDSIWEKLEEERGCKVEVPAESSARSVASPPPFAGNMVGFDGYSTQLLLKLTGDQPDQQIIPIVGMGGLGKTTLARNAYDSVPVWKQFNYRAWAVMSQTFIVRDILLEILSCLEKSKDVMDKKTEFELRELLHQTLFNRKYLIVLDDMWSIDAWYKIKFCFPNNCTGSRILVTTRISEVANHFGSIGLELSVLNEGHSWKLFCEKAFPHEDCPADLENCGREIVRKCGGLPLAIVVIGGVLGSIPRTLGKWENVEKDITSILNTANDDQCLKLLSLSYIHLPARLKPCFLYLGIFPEDEEIHVSKLIKLWVAEGFVKPNKDQSLEEIAEGYIKNLVDRNLISVHSLRWSGKVKIVRIHDLLREMCVRVAEKEKFLCVTSELNKPKDMDRQRRCVIFDGSTCEVCTTGESTRSIILNRGERQMHLKSRLLRVLVGVYSVAKYPISQQVNLRFFTHEFEKSEDPLPTRYLPSSISLIWNLQTLIIKEGPCTVRAPSEFWKMPQFRHVMCHSITLPEPSPGDGIVLHNLQTLGDVADFEFSEEACKKMPNIKKLHVFHSRYSKNGVDFALFNKLESLHYDFTGERRQDDLLESFFKFPNSLKKLTLVRFPLQREHLEVISSLPHLEALILEKSISGKNWDLAELEFHRLRFLRVIRSDLKCWNANDTHFPVLENLALEKMCYLHKIPLEIAYIPTLQWVSVICCSVSASISAVKIKEEQENFGIKGLQLKIHQDNAQIFMASVKQEGLTDVNFQITEG